MLFLVRELDEALTQLSNWQRFGTHLPGIEYSDLQIIEYDRKDVSHKKLALYGLWISRYPDGTWRDVIRALQTADERTIAATIEQEKGQYMFIGCTDCL